MSLSVAESYAYCREVSRRRAKNFYYSFVLLKNEQRDAMCAMYAFMRYCDDLSDEAGATTAETMRQWRDDLQNALEGRFSGHPVWPAFHDAVTRYRIPHIYFHDMIDGVSSDLEPQVIRTFDDLYKYCYRVASVVGLTIIHIFGFDDKKALELAEKCGIAFQLTNILRDVQEDIGLGRVYLPKEDLDRFGVRPPSISYSPEFVELMRFEAARARAYYNEAMPLIGMVHRDSRASLWALIQIYYRLLGRIEQKQYRVLDQRIRLSTPEKAWLVVEAGTRRLAGAF
ncbi:MAG TPA: phytoene/squalene synthase family protein [Bryobacteraceae bacterium]|nr:phytoene/squalene synthase family protein [Bryobacteraceae bacterium]